LEGLKYKKVVQVMYRNKGTGEIVCTLEMSGTDRRCRERLLSGNHQYSLEVVHFFSQISRAKRLTGVICRPHVHYSDGSKALLYLEEWRRETNKIAICELTKPSDH
jgi:hypothetical protein